MRDTFERSAMGSFRVRRTATLSLVLGLLLFPLNQISSQPFDALIRGGKIHYQGKRFEKAKELFAKAVESNPQNPGAHFLLGLALAQLAEYKAAAAEFNTTLILDSAYLKDIKKKEEERGLVVTSFFNAAQEFIKTLSYDSAIPLLVRVSQIEENNERSLRLLAQLYAELDRLAELQRTALLFKEETPTRYSLLGLYFFKKAEKDTNPVLKNLYADSAVSNYLEAAFFLKRRYSEASERLKNELKISEEKTKEVIPSLLFWRQSLDLKKLKCYIEDSLKIKDEAKAREVTIIGDELFSINQELNTGYFRAGTLTLERATREEDEATQQRFLAKSESLFTQALEANPQDIDARYNIGLALYHQKKDSQAAEVYKEVLSSVRLNFADLKISQELRDSILKQVTDLESKSQKFIELSDNIFSRLERELTEERPFLRNYRWLYLLNDSTFLSNQQPGSLENLYFLLGASLTSVGVNLKENKDLLGANQRFSEAVEAFNTVLKIDPKSSEAIRHLIICYREKGEKEKALELLKKLDELKR